MKKPIVIATILFLLFMGIGLVASIYIKKGEQRALDQFNEVKNALTSATKEVKFYKDASGVEHARAEQLQVDKAVLEEVVKDQAEKLKVKPKFIQGSTRVITQTEVVVKFDTLYQDKYVYIQKDGDSIKISMSDSLYLNRFEKRTWFLGPKKPYADVYNTNKYIKVKGLTDIELAERKKRFSINGGIGYDLINQRIIFPNISAGYTLIRF